VKQLHSALSQTEQSLSSPSPERLHAWRLFFESALALLDVLDTELQQAVGIPQRWYDVLIHLEESPEGIRMNELAERILYSKSGFTRVVDRMEAEGLVRRVRPAHDRRSILVVLTEAGTKKLDQARRHHRVGIDRHFSQHVTDADVKVLTRVFEKISAHVRPLRPGRVGDSEEPGGS
jgi:DNA-binding MarR family transcriptional regulator